MLLRHQLLYEQHQCLKTMQNKRQEYRRNLHRNIQFEKGLEDLIHTGDCSSWKCDLIIEAYEVHDCLHITSLVFKQNH